MQQTRPGNERHAMRSLPTVTPLKQDDASKQESINNRTLDQHCDGEQSEKVNSIPRLPFFLPFNFLPYQQTNKEDYKCECHVSAHQSCQAWSQQIQSKRAERNETGN